MRFKYLLPTIAILGSTLPAQDLHFGLQAGLSIPQADVKDLVDKKMGATGGFNVGLEFLGGHVVRPRLDYTWDKGTVDEVDTTNTTLFVGVDYNFFFSGKASEGFYVLASLGYANTKMEFSSGPLSINDNQSAFAWGAGAGYQFTHLMGAEARFTSTRPKDMLSNLVGTSTPEYKNDTINVALTFRF